jgi:Protein of unknown function (DUF998)
MTWLPVERARWTVRGLLVAFWVLVLVGGQLNPGYAPWRDHVSDLASFGARAPWVGILAIAAFGVADVVAARVVGVSSRWAAVSLVVAGLAGLVIAADRIHCTGGAAGCATSTIDDATWTDSVHSGAVVVNAFAFSLAMLVCALGTFGAPHSRWWRAIVAGLAVMSLGFLAQSLGTDLAGTWQRGWLLTNTVVLLIVTSRSRDPGRVDDHGAG